MDTSSSSIAAADSSRLVVTRTTMAFSKPIVSTESGRSMPHGSGGTIVFSLRFTLADCNNGGSFSLAFAVDPTPPFPPPPAPRPPPNILRKLLPRGVSPLPPAEEDPPALVSRTIPRTLATNPLFLTYLSTAVSKKLISASPLPYKRLVTKSSNIWDPTNASEKARTSDRCTARNSCERNPAPPYAPSFDFAGNFKNLRYFCNKKQYVSKNDSCTASH
mmetsp:Transcript_16043/g.34698  ORF Transcript_16043/g.34698 Transcript_16043/m.34698 type:complete len:218 (-) Transcript_16043:884-1537(-)